MMFIGPNGQPMMRVMVGGPNGPVNQPIPMMPLYTNPCPPSPCGPPGPVTMEEWYERWDGPGHYGGGGNSHYGGGGNSNTQTHTNTHTHTHSKTEHHHETRGRAPRNLGNSPPAVRVAGGWKAFDPNNESANAKLFYGYDVVNSRYGETAPRNAPRINGASSNPQPNIKSKREMDGQSFGALSSEFWPGTEFTRRDRTDYGGEIGYNGGGGGGSYSHGSTTTTTNHQQSSSSMHHSSSKSFTGGKSGHHQSPSHGRSGGNAPSKDGKRYEGVDEGSFYDPVVSTKRWDGVFGGPFKAMHTDAPQRHGVEGGYSRELAAPYSNVG